MLRLPIATGMALRTREQCKHMDRFIRLLLLLPLFL
jgi:hypothetical protein